MSDVMGLLFVVPIIIVIWVLLGILVYVLVKSAREMFK